MDLTQMLLGISRTSLTIQVAELSQVSIGAVMTLAAIVKGCMLPAFRQGVADLELIPFTFVPIVSLLVPVLELAVGVSLISGVATQFAAIGAMALFLAFGIVIALALTTNEEPTTCRCFGLRRRLNWRTVARNVGLALLAASALGGDASVVYATLGVAVLLGSLNGVRIKRFSQPSVEHTM